MRPRFLALLAFTAFPAFAQEAASDHPYGGTLTANVGAVSDYVYRGVSNNDEQPTAQGGLDWVGDNGLYVGIWGSRFDFDDGTKHHTEIDYYAGYAFDVNDWLKSDTSLTRISYPGNDFHYSYTELAEALSHDFGVAALTGTVAYSPENLGHSGPSTYVEASADVPLPHDVHFTGALGYWAIDDEVTYGFSDYTNWRLGLAYNLEGFDLKLDYTDTDISRSQCPDGCEGRVALTISRTFAIIP